MIQQLGLPVFLQQFTVLSILDHIVFLVLVRFVCHRTEDAVASEIETFGSRNRYNMASLTFYLYLYSFMVINWKTTQVFG